MSLYGKTRSRMFVVVVNLCALVDGGQQWMVIVFFFYGRSGVAAISKGVLFFNYFSALSKIGTRIRSY